MEAQLGKPTGAPGPPVHEGIDEKSDDKRHGNVGGQVAALGQRAADDVGADGADDGLARDEERKRHAVRQLGAVVAECEEVQNAKEATVAAKEEAEADEQKGERGRKGHHHVTHDGARGVLLGHRAHVKEGISEEHQGHERGPGDRPGGPSGKGGHVRAS